MLTVSIPLLELLQQTLGIFGLKELNMTGTEENALSVVQQQVNTQGERI
jgi:hypothetical protein